MATCEMCGSIVNSTVTIKVAGTNMQACSNCKHMGKPVNVDQSFDRTHTFRRNKKVGSSEEVIANYASVLNGALAKKGLNIHQLAKALSIKESTLNQYFSSKIKPTVKIAKQLERFLEISLIEEVAETDPQDYIEEESTGSGASPSLGDMLLKQLKKK